MPEKVMTAADHILHWKRVADRHRVRAEMAERAQRDIARELAATRAKLQEAEARVMSLAGAQD